MYRPKFSMLGKSAIFFTCLLSFLHQNRTFDLYRFSSKNNLSFCRKRFHSAAQEVTERLHQRLYRTNVADVCSGSTDVLGLCSIWPALRQRTVQVLWEEGRCWTHDGVACCVPTWRRTYHQQRICPAKISPQQQAVLYNWLLYPAVLCMLH